MVATAAASPETAAAADAVVGTDVTAAVTEGMVAVVRITTIAAATMPIMPLSTA